jgi:hypothetical protein
VAQHIHVVGVQDQDRLCGSAAVDAYGLAVELVHHGSGVRALGAAAVPGKPTDSRRRTAAHQGGIRSRGGAAACELLDMAREPTLRRNQLSAVTAGIADRPARLFEVVRVRLLGHAEEVDEEGVDGVAAEYQVAGARIPFIINWLIVVHRESLHGFRDGLDIFENDRINRQIAEQKKSAI